MKSCNLLSATFSERKILQSSEIGKAQLPVYISELEAGHDFDKGLAGITRRS